ncbi:hypothetical protein KM043_004523 [Ampulex compressa]|nr:hypothetical protein KM043_004523 [Ampulex compressa]
MTPFSILFPLLGFLSDLLKRPLDISCIPVFLHLSSPPVIRANAFLVEKQALASCKFPSRFEPSPLGPGGSDKYFEHHNVSHGVVAQGVLGGPRRRVPPGLP